MNMKTKQASKAAALMCAACLALLLPACRNPVEPPVQAGGGPGILALTIGDPAGARTIMPDTMPGAFAVYRLTFTAKTAGNTDKEEVWEQASGTVELAAGTWDLTITAYMQYSGGTPDREAAEGSVLGIVITAGNVTDSIDVSLAPIKGGEGTFSWDISYPADVVTAKVDITEITQEGERPYATLYFTGGMPAAGTADETAMPAGKYRAVFVLVNGSGINAVLGETLHVYRNMESRFTQTFGPEHFAVSDLARQLAWLRAYALDGGEYTIELSGDESITPDDAALPSDRTDLTVTLLGTAPSTVQLSGQGRLFDIPPGVTLVLDSNVTLKGSSANTDSLVWVNGNAALIMNAGSKITGNNTAPGLNSYGGGVYVGYSGTFTMTGGEISGNTVSSYSNDNGGGVYVGPSSTFTMNGGEISGNTVSSISGGGGGVYVYDSGIFRISGGKIYGSGEGDLSNSPNYNRGAALYNSGTALYGPAGSWENPLHSTNATIHVINGVLQLPQGDSLADQLARLDLTAQSGSSYTVTLTGGTEIITAGQSVLPLDRTNLTVTLLDTAPSVVQLSGQGSLFDIPHGVTLVLDSNVTLKGVSANNAPLVRVNRNTTLIMNAGSKITGNTSSSWDGGGVFMSHRLYDEGDHGTFTMNGGEISGNTGSGGGGVYVVGGTFTMNGGKISGNTASSAYNSGGGVYVAGYECTFTMNGGEISGNTGSSYSNDNGGGVYVGSPNTFTMNGGEISGNTVSNYYGGGGGGGGVYVNGDTRSWGTFRISNGVIYGNNAGTNSNTAYDGAALYKGTYAVAERGTFSGTTFTKKGDLDTTDDTIRVENGDLLP